MTSYTWNINIPKKPLELLKERIHREISIKIGFFIEMLCFVLSGLFLLFSIWFSLVFIIFGSIAASIVTKKIKKNALENYKWGLG